MAKLFGQHSGTALACKMGKHKYKESPSQQLSALLSAAVAAGSSLLASGKRAATLVILTVNQFKSLNRSTRY